MSSRGEGAIIDRRARTVRLRHELPGFVYELRGEGDALEAVRVDRLTGEEESYGTIEMKRGRWRGQSGQTRHKTDALAMIARAWNSARFLRREKTDGLGDG